MPVYMLEETNRILADKLNERSFWHMVSVLEKYDILEKSIKYTIKEVGAFKPKTTTGDKLSIEMKELIKKRMELKRKKLKRT